MNTLTSMPDGKLQTRQDAEDFVQGCLFMGTGGRGTPQEGVDLLEQALADGLSLEWTDASAVPDESHTATAYGMGSIAPLAPETKEKIERLALTRVSDLEAMVQAVGELERHQGQPISCLVASELGAGNTPLALVTAARLDITIVDGDYAGRGIPDEMQTTPFLFGKQSWPFASVDQWGNVALVSYTVNPQLLERIGKMLAVSAYGSTVIASTCLPATEMKEILVPGTLSRCLGLGRAMRQAREKNDRDPIDAALTMLEGWRLFEGVVKDKQWEDRDGYMYGTTHIQGTGNFGGQRFEIWFKNENHVTWKDGQPWVCSPDLVTVVDRRSGCATSNSTLYPGQEVVVCGVRGWEPFRTPEALRDGSGPEYFGFDIEYRPIEQLVGAIPAV